MKGKTRKNLGKHSIWIKKMPGLRRTVWEVDGMMYIHFEHGKHEVKYNEKTGWYYTLNI